MVRRTRIHALKRPKLRQTWNKYNLYNLFRQRDPKIGSFDHETFFQQKWRAKGLLRSYHGSHLRERDWERMFSKRLLSVANMDARYMAQEDGSEKAAGRGSGKDQMPAWNKESIPAKTLTPYMNMTFAPMESRLDIAVFRALFASSAMQARQFILHNGVKVNGKTTPHPTYKLNPGDMFSVNPEMVMYATGRAKGRPRTDIDKSWKQISREQGLCFTCKKPGHTASKCPDKEKNASAAPAAEDAAEANSESEVTYLSAQDPETTDKLDAPLPNMKPTRQAIQSLVIQAKDLLTSSKATTLNMKQKRNLRGFIKQAKPLLSRAGKATATPTEIANELTNMVKDLQINDIAKDTQKAAAEEKEEFSEAAASSPQSIEDLSPDELKALERLMREEEENPYDPNKPYRTPWEPRPYMSPFAFIPKYLEVNQNVCSAVYLRHPVARTASAEVPTPYPYRINQLAFNWYLRRR